MITRAFKQVIGRSTGRGCAKSFAMAMTLVLMTLLAACTSAKSNNRAIGNRALETELVTAVDENGNPLAVKGYATNDGLLKDGQVDLSELAAKNDPKLQEGLFTFKAPEGYESEFSEPILTTGAFLQLTAGSCSDYTYQDHVPTVAEVLSYATARNQCGKLTANFCIKLIPQNGGGDAVFLKSPVIKARLACAEESFAQAAVGPENGQTLSNSTSVNLAIQSSAYIKDVYITNTPGCTSGGTWKAVSALEKGWVLAPSAAGEAKVYTAFRDFAGRVSECRTTLFTVSAGSTGSSGATSASSGSSASGGSSSGGSTGGTGSTTGTTTAGTTGSSGGGPTATSILIDADATYTTSLSVSLSLAATGADSMYVTATAGCEAGGTWEAYATSKAWTLHTGDGLQPVYVRFKSTSGQSACISDAITLDTLAPSLSSFTINGGATTTNATAVSLGLASADASHMYVTNTAGCASGGSWEAFATSKAWTLAAAQASNTIYVKLKDLAGNVSTCASASIVHSGAAPTNLSLAIAGGAAYTVTASVNLTIGATDATDMYVTATSGCTSGGSWEAYATSKAWSLGTTNGTIPVYIKFKDIAGNESGCTSDDIIFDNQPPTSTSIGFGGASYTTSTGVTLSLAATDAAEMYLSNTSCSAGGGWESFLASKAWTISQTNAVATVYAKFRDSYQNESSCISATITHDTTNPASPSIAINSGASYSSSTSVTLTLAATDANPLSMYVTDTAACAGGGTWESFAASRSWTLPSLNASNTVYAQFKDAAGNSSSCTSATITHDNQAPTGGSLSISSGAAATSSSTVTLGLSATGASEMYITNTATCSGDGAWEAYNTTKTGWTLGQTNQSTSVYVKFRDAALNTSGCATSSIVHDNQAPSSPSSFNDGVNTLSTTQTPSFTWAAASDPGGSGIAGYQLALGTASGLTDVATWTDVGNVLSANLSSASVSGLSLTWGTTYYASVRAVDQAGNPSNQANGNGFLVGTNWTQQAFVKAVNNASTSEFGKVVSLQGTTLVVSAPDEGNATTVITNGTGAASGGGAGNSGAVYVYVRNGTTWGQQAYIKPVVTGSALHFGEALSLGTDLLAVGRYRDPSVEATIINGTTASTDTTAANAGAVFIYKRTGVNWQQEAYIKSYNAQNGDNFGITVSLSGDTLAVGAPLEDSAQSTIINGTGTNTTDGSGSSGAAYVYKRTAGNWEQEAFLKAVNYRGGARFGSTVALSGETLAVGADQEPSAQGTVINGATASADNTGDDVGAVYIYTRNAVSWSQQAYLKPPNPTDSDFFGRKLAIDGDTVAVGAPGEDSNDATITNGTAANADNTNTDSGGVYVFKRTGTVWAQEAYIKAANNTSGDQFGSSLALSGNFLAVGAALEDSNEAVVTNGTTASAVDTSADSGAVYIYRRNGTTWVPASYIKAANNTSGDQFGTTIALSSESLIVGAPNEDSAQTTITNGTGTNTTDTVLESGAVYIYTPQ